MSILTIRASVLRTIKLLGHESAVPDQNGVRRRNVSNLAESITAEPLANFGQSGSLLIGEPQAFGQMGSEDAILGGQIFVLEQQLLVHHTVHIRQ